MAAPVPSQEYRGGAVWPFDTLPPDEQDDSGAAVKVGVADAPCARPSVLSHKRAPPTHLRKSRPVDNTRRISVIALAILPDPARAQRLSGKPPAAHLVVCGGTVPSAYRSEPSNVLRGITTLTKGLRYMLSRRRYPPKSESRGDDLSNATRLDLGTTHHPVVNRMIVIRDIHDRTVRSVLIRVELATRIPRCDVDLCKVASARSVPTERCAVLHPTRRLTCRTLAPSHWP